MRLRFLNIGGYGPWTPASGKLKETFHCRSKAWIKKYAKKGERSAITILAKDLVRGRKARDRLFTAKAHLGSAI